MRRAIHPLPQYAFMAWCLVKHRDNFTFTFYFRGEGDNWTAQPASQDELKAGSVARSTEVDAHLLGEAVILLHASQSTVNWVSSTNQYPKSYHTLSNVKTVKQSNTVYVCFKAKVMQTWCVRYRPRGSRCLRSRKAAVESYRGHSTYSPGHWQGCWEAARNQRYKTITEALPSLV
jgi:hypothetical protein